MCGITGFLNINQRLQESAYEVIRSMTQKLLHRGPDAQECRLLENLALGFSRLSIIGLGNGMQPIFNEDESLVLLCNGEIFNYLELRKELMGASHRFRTDSDVEVLLHLYEEYGMSFLNRVNGQFAFVLYDRTKRLLFCARDPMGIAPFFYTQADGAFIFGSEIKAILQHPGVKPEVDPVGLDQTFTFAGLVSPRTMFKGIHSLENGHWICIDQTGRIKKTEYWDLVYPEGELSPGNRTETDYIDELEGLLEDSITLRLRADVRSGLYLSGGLDSSMITMKTSQLHPHLIEDAFAIDFTDSEHSESYYQRLVADAAGMKLHQKTFFFNDITERLKLSVYHSECPVKETYNTASLALSRAVRNKGIKVILSGEGADELFAGYVGYRFDKLRALNLMHDRAAEEEKALRERLWGDPDFYYERNFLEFNPVKKALYANRFRESFEEINCLNHPVIDIKKIQGRSLVNKRAYIDYKLRLVDHLVSDHGDRMALGNSVEVRYPFLDRHIADFSTKIPTDLKINEFTEKYILKKLASRFVPQEICDREKFHFIAPGSPQILQHRNEHVQDLLSYDLIKSQGYFDPDMIETLKRTYEQPGFVINAPYESDILITVITFGMLLENFF